MVRRHNLALTLTLLVQQPNFVLSTTKHESDKVGGGSGELSENPAPLETLSKTLLRCGVVTACSLSRVEYKQQLQKKACKCKKNTQ